MAYAQTNVSFIILFSFMFITELFYFCNAQFLVWRLNAIISLSDIINDWYACYMLQCCFTILLNINTYFDTLSSLQNVRKSWSVQDVRWIA